MKSLLLSALIIGLASCGGSSNESIVPETITALNFSEAKYNEDLLGKFVIPKMNKVLLNLVKIQEKTSSCNESFNPKSVSLEWREATLSYQLIRPLEVSLLDRNPEVSKKLTERYLGGAYSASRCDLQLNTATQSLFDKTLIDDPAFNSIEALIFYDLSNSNFCAGKNADTITTWQSSGTVNSDTCRHINFIAKTAHKQLSAINSVNSDLYKMGRSNEVFATSKLQAVYDNMSVFTDQVLKDNKVGQPLGLTSTCPFAGRTCPTAVEHRPSKLFFESVSKNLEGIMAIFNEKTSMLGSPQAKGLYQFLASNDKVDVATDFYLNLVEAHKISTSLHGEDLEKIAASLDGADNKVMCEETTVQNMLVPACALFKSIKSLSDKVKIDLRLALSVSKTKQIEGDSD